MQEIIGSSPKHFSDTFARSATRFGTTSDGGFSFRMVAVRKHRSRTSVQAGVISQPRPGQHRGLRPFLPLCSSLRISFVKRPCRCNSGGRLQSFCSRSPTQRHDVENVDSAGASPAASTNSIRPASIKVMQRTFNPLNGERYPGGPPIHCRVV